MLLQLVSVQSAAAASDRGIDFLEQRFESWPQWSLPAPLPRPRAKQDLIYPDWFSGTWQVTSEALDDSGQAIPDDRPLVHKVRFLRNRRNELIGDRPYNATSVGKALLGEQLLSVEQDPNKVNRQLARFRDDVLLETTVIGRRETSPKAASDFFSDELVLQILHGPGAPRLSRIETLTHYERCGPDICADQRQVSHAGPGLKTDQTLEGRSSRFRLTLKPLRLDEG
ncbi:hypothetical protein MITS9509_03251 [Synechococcus sp. MIT S9509]|uniref:DUF6816 family protein n=2 Tax=unclassified Synechococcus TaxID=2626047 RepID=UPI0007BBA595|nr:POLO box duplicated region [Synechococcus sp. MIT S9504]KZR83828.1 hypothetical protein MITS9504_03210 [Synechococcus sp. MIT S9504]KZR88652.1 hypothetical protein MITS9509_03251 [Synechococcus sp. MIT S9509]